MSLEEAAMGYFFSIDFFHNPYLICLFTGTPEGQLEADICSYLFDEGLIHIDYEKSKNPLSKWYFISEKGKSIHPAYKKQRL